MNTRSAKVREIFDQAAEITGEAERRTFLDSACAGDADLRSQVDALLKAYTDAGSFLDRPALDESAFSGASQTEAFDSTPAAPCSPLPTGGEGLGVRGKSPDEALAFLAPSSKPGSIGRLGHYEILEVIGKGGFGTVLKAFDEKLHRVVAIKVLSPAYAAVGSARKRFIREAQTAAAVKNEHVVAIHGVEDEAQPPYLVMEIIDGISLQDKLDKRGPLSLKEILRIGLQTAEGLAAAHKQGLVHRDIKPANILLENGVERVKITDFGLARAVDDASITQSGTVAGTPMYMSPEQAEGVPIDHRSDLFSLGTVLYAMCTGHPPFRASGTHAVLKRVIDASPRPIREINNEVPDWLADIIAKLHAKKPEDRFQTAKEVAELLGQRLADVQAGRAVEGRAEGRKAPVEAPTNAPVNRPLTGLGSPRRRRIAVALLVLFMGIAPLAAYVWNEYSKARRGQVEYVFAEPGIKIIIQGGGVESTYSGTASVSEQRSSGVTHQLRAYDRTGKEYFYHAFTVEPRGKRVVHVPAPPQAIAAQKVEPGWVQLFNGKDLTGWKQHPDDPNNIWAVEKGEIVGQWGTSYLFSERGDFEDFHLRVEAQINQTGDAGVVFRTDFALQKAKGGSVQYTSGYEAQIGVRPTWKVHTGSLSWPLGQSANDAVLKRGPLDPHRPDEWFLLEIIARGPHIQALVNGKTTAEYQDDSRTFRRGHLALQSWGANLTSTRFRKIEIKELPAEEPGWVQLFNGKDLDGWSKLSGAGGTWRVENDHLIGTGGQGAPGRLHSKRDDFTNFHLRIEAKYTGTRTQIEFRTQGSAPYTGYYVNMCNGKAPFNTGALLCPFGKKPFSEQMNGDLTKSGEWFTLEVVAQGNRLQTFVDGKKTVDIVDPAETFKKGALSLIVSFNDELRVRKIEIKELPPAEPGWVQLFNGKDLDGWKASKPGSWQVEKGHLIGKGDRAAVRTERFNFADFHVRVEAKYVGGEGRLFLRGQPANIGEGYEVFMNNKKGDFQTGALLAISLANNQGQSGRVKEQRTKVDEWFTLEVVARGKHLQTFVNGEKALDFVDPSDKYVAHGCIGLGIAGKDAELHVRKVEIKEFPPAPPAK